MDSRARVLEHPPVDVVVGDFWHTARFSNLEALPDARNAIFFPTFPVNPLVRWLAGWSVGRLVMRLIYS